MRADSNCVRLNSSLDSSLCARFVAPYADNVYLSQNAFAQAMFNTILQQYCDVFVAEFNFRAYYFPFACALAFPRCDVNTGGALLLCPTGPSGCDSKLPPHICQQQLPVAQPGEPCKRLHFCWFVSNFCVSAGTPIGDPFWASSSASERVGYLYLLVVLLLMSTLL
jgi:hypothetical protein